VAAKPQRERIVFRSSPRLDRVTEKAFAKKFSPVPAVQGTVDPACDPEYRCKNRSIVAPPLRKNGGPGMAGMTLTRADLSEVVYQKVGLSRTESAALVELVLREITECLSRGENVKLSSFGSFVVRQKGRRIGRNPKTGEEVPIEPRKVMVFKPSNILKSRINDGKKR
jgi:integration host factor subunit alpha